MTGESLIADDIADEVVARATAKLPTLMTDGEIAAITLGEWWNAVAAVLLTYGVQGRDDYFDDHERDGEAEYGPDR